MLINQAYCSLSGVIPGEQEVDSQGDGKSKRKGKKVYVEKSGIKSSH